MHLLQATLLLALLSATLPSGLGFGRTCSSRELCVPIERCAEKLTGIGGQRCERSLEDHICSEKESEELRVCCTPGSGGPAGGLLPGPCGRQPVPQRKNAEDRLPPFGAYPWVVAVRPVPENFRGDVRAGVLLSPRFVLSLALPDDRNDSIYTVDYGTRNLSAATDCVPFGKLSDCFRAGRATGKNLIPHPLIKSPDPIGMGLYKLDAAIDFDDRVALVEPVCLPASGEDPPPGRAGIFAYWDKDAAGDVVLRTAVVRILAAQDRCSGEPNFGSIKEWRNKICAERVKEHSGRGYLGGVLLLESDGEPPTFTVVGIERWSTSDLVAFHSLVRHLLWIRTNAVP